ncbi:MAG: hypothetical protein AAGG51_23395 [Cyanobacteria bacterium P01_G01_bin.54]
MPPTQVHAAPTVIQGEFVESARSSTSSPTASPWQQRRNGKGYTFRAELARLEGRLGDRFSRLHQHLSHSQAAQQQTLSTWFVQLDERLLQRLAMVDRKLNAVLLAQRARSRQLILLWLMGLLAVLGVYITLVHPLLRPAKPVLPQPATPPSATPQTIPPPSTTPQPPLSRPTVPLPHEVPQQ